jgi:hypothetical protein
VGGTLIHSTSRKMFGTLTKLENAAESHPSSARFVGTLLTCKTRRPKKDTTVKLTKLLHEFLTLATTKNLDLQNADYSKTFCKPKLTPKKLR